MLREDQLAELQAIFNAFDYNGDGYLEVEEVSTIWASCGVSLTDAEVLDMVTELKPDLRKLPFDEFVNIMCKPMVAREALEQEMADTFPAFSGGGSSITADSLEAAMDRLGRPISRDLSKEMIREISSGVGAPSAKVSHAEYCASVGILGAVKPPPSKAQDLS